MMQIVIKRSDGGVSVLALIAEAAQAFEFDCETVVAAEVAAWQQTFPEATALSWRVMPDEAILAADRTFRDAWTDTTKAAVIDIDMTRARDIWKDRLRKARAPMLEAADIEFMRALEDGGATTSISLRKQALRDVTADPRIAAANTADELKAIWPEVLNAGV